MVKTKLAISFCLFLCTLSLKAQELKFSWKQLSVDGSRTGVTAPGNADLAESTGTFDAGKYIAPNGRVFQTGTTPSVAEAVAEAQLKLADLNEVIGYAVEDMYADRPESKLSNWTVDLLMAAVSDNTGEEVNAGIINIGGIRASFYKGPVSRDNLISMFPFKNRLCLVKLKGKDLRYWLEYMASTRVEAVGGIRMEIDDGRLSNVTVGGNPIDDDAVYNIATIDFLLSGGDGYFLSRNSLSVQILDCSIIDAVQPYVMSVDGLSYRTDGRVIVR